MKAIFLLFIFISSILYGLNLVFESPYHFYNSFLEEGIDSSFLKVKRPEAAILEAKYISDFSNGVKDADNLWENISLDNFTLPFSVYHPSFITIPSPLSENKKIYSGLKYQQSNGEDIINFKQLEATRIDLSLPPEKLFRIPLVRKYILDKSKAEIWNDIFSKNLNIKFSYSLLLSSTLQKWDEHNPLELSYYIYLFKMRQKIYLPDFNKIYRIKTNHAVYEKVGENENVKKYYGQIYKNGRLLNYEITSYKNNQYVQLVLTRIFNSIDLVEGIPSELAVKYYTKFKSLNYKDRLTPESMGYLYAAWSHDKSNSAYIRELIQFFERDAKFISVLQNFYAFARAVWGSTFSNKDAYLDEDAQVLLKRKIEEEKRKEEMELGNFEIQDIENLPKGEKIKYLLKKGKKNKVIKENQVIEN